MLIVVALGGNALSKRGQALEAQVQRDNVKVAVQSIARIVGEHRVIITHGNGPQIGLLALQNDAYKEVSPYALDLLGAETDGLIGYLLQQELNNLLPEHHVVTLLTQTVVDANDPAFHSPDKFVGPIYTQDVALKLAKDKSWTVKSDGDYFRRVVPSPQPLDIVELDIIRYLLKLENTVLICAGGGGIPVCRDENNQLNGVEVVVDKDRVSKVLAKSIQADGLVILTDVSAVETAFGQPDSRQIKTASPSHLKEYHFPAGSMGPKIESVCAFVESGGSFASIGKLEDLPLLLEGRTGTRITRDCVGIEFY